MEFDVQWDIEESVFDNIFNKKKKKRMEEENVVDYHNEYMHNLGLD